MKNAPLPTSNTGHADSGHAAISGSAPPDIDVSWPSTDHELERASGFSAHRLPVRHGNQLALRDLDTARLVAAYTYNYADGRRRMQVLRVSPGPGRKQFLSRHWTGEAWAWGLRQSDLCLYRLPDVRRAVDHGRAVCIVEGEKDADRLTSAGLVATCNPLGAYQWRDTYAAGLDGAHVIVIPDHDVPGITHAIQVAASLQETAASVRLVFLPDANEGDDVSAWLDRGGEVADLLSATRRTYLMDDIQAFEGLVGPGGGRDAHDRSREGTKRLFGRVKTQLSALGPSSRPGNAHLQAERSCTLEAPGIASVDLYDTGGRTAGDESLLRHLCAYRRLKDQLRAGITTEVPELSARLACARFEVNWTEAVHRQRMSFLAAWRAVSKDASSPGSLPKGGASLHLRPGTVVLHDVLPDQKGKSRASNARGPDAQPPESRREAWGVQKRRTIRLSGARAAVLEACSPGVPHEELRDALHESTHGVGASISARGGTDAAEMERCVSTLQKEGLVHERSGPEPRAVIARMRQDLYTRTAPYSPSLVQIGRIGRLLHKVGHSKEQPESSPGSSSASLDAAVRLDHRVRALETGVTRLSLREAFDSEFVEYWRSPEWSTRAGVIHELTGRLRRHFDTSVLDLPPLVFSSVSSDMVTRAPAAERHGAAPSVSMMEAVSEDRHFQAAKTAVHALADAFPEAGIGITGSVASQTHGPQSDVDLLLVSRAFRHNVQYGLLVDGIQCPVVCLHPGVGEAQIVQWAQAYGGRAALPCMIASAHVAQDPHGELNGLIDAVSRARTLRREQPDMLVGQLKQAAEQLHVQAARSAEQMRPHLNLERLDRAVAAWMIRSGRIAADKRDNRHLLERMRADDAQTTPYLKQAVPSRASLTSVTPLVTYIFENVE